MIRIYALITMLLTTVAHFQLMAQHHDHQHSRNEIGLSAGPIYSFEHSEWGAGAHLHYYRTFGDHSKWAWGGMVEYVKVHDDHFTLGAGVNYQVTGKLSIGILPGITFFHHGNNDHHAEKHEHNKKAAFSTHIEAVYDLFHWKEFHFGAVVDFSLSKDDSHGMIGVHAAYCF